MALANLRLDGMKFGPIGSLFHDARQVAPLILLKTAETNNNKGLLLNSTSGTPTSVPTAKQKS